MKPCIRIEEEVGWQKRGELRNRQKPAEPTPQQHRGEHHAAHRRGREEERRQPVEGEAEEDGRADPLELEDRLQRDLEPGRQLAHHEPLEIEENRLVGLWSHRIVEEPLPRCRLTHEGEVGVQIVVEDQILVEP
jgi:hypothetical protein